MSQPSIATWLVVGACTTCGRRVQDVTFLPLDDDLMRDLDLTGITRALRRQCLYQPCGHEMLRGPDGHYPIYAVREERTQTTWYYVGDGALENSNHHIETKERQP